MVPDPDLYRRMSEPYESQVEAECALKAFLGAVRVLREKHRIAEVVMLAGVHAGGEVVAMTQTLGDAARAPKLALGLYRQTMTTIAESHERAAAQIRAALDEEP